MVASLADDRGQLLAATRARRSAHKEARRAEVTGRELQRAALRDEAGSMTRLAEPIAFGVTGLGRIVGYFGTPPAWIAERSPSTTTTEASK